MERRRGGYGADGARSEWRRTSVQRGSWSWVCPGRGKTLVGVAITLRAGRPGFVFQRGQRSLFSPLLCPDLRLWGPPSLLFSVCRRFIYEGLSGRSCKPTVQLDLMPRLKCVEPYVHCPHTSSCLGAPVICSSAVFVAVCVAPVLCHWGPP
jgi:hypothetical protein